MKTETAERKFHATIFQRKMEQSEIEFEIKMLEKRFKKMNKYDNVSAWFDLQDQLGVLYKRLMKMWRIRRGTIRN